MRKLDSKFHLQGEQIIKSSNGQPIPDGEPLFFFRGRDYLALPTLIHYRTLCAEDDCTDYQMKSLDEMISVFHRFSEENPQVMKQPGITRGL